MVMSKTFTGARVAAAALDARSAELLGVAARGDAALLADGGVLGGNPGVAEAVAWCSLEARRQPAKSTRPVTTTSGKRDERRGKSASFTTRAARVLAKT